MERGALGGEEALISAPFTAVEAVSVDATEIKDEIVQLRLNTAASLFNMIYNFAGNVLL